MKKLMIVLSTLIGFGLASSSFGADDVSGKALSDCLAGDRVYNEASLMQKLSPLAGPLAGKLEELNKKGEGALLQIKIDGSDVGQIHVHKDGSSSLGVSSLHNRMIGCYMEYAEVDKVFEIKFLAAIQD